MVVVYSHFGELRPIQSLRDGALFNRLGASSTVASSSLSYNIYSLEMMGARRKGRKGARHMQEHQTAPTNHPGLLHKILSACIHNDSSVSLWKVYWRVELPAFNPTLMLRILAALYDVTCSF